MTSTGLTSAAKIQMPLTPFLMDLMTSLTPLLTFFYWFTQINDLFTSFGQFEYLDP